MKADDVRAPETPSMFPHITVSSEVPGNSPHHICGLLTVAAVLTADVCRCHSLLGAKLAKGEKRKCGVTKKKRKKEKVLVLEAMEVPTVEPDGTGDTGRHLRPVRV